MSNERASAVSVVAVQAAVAVVTASAVASCHSTKIAFHHDQMQLEWKRRSLFGWLHARATTGSKLIAAGVYGATVGAVVVASAPLWMVAGALKCLRTRD
jgi:hypothetical protein